MAISLRDLENDIRRSVGGYKTLLKSEFPQRVRSYVQNRAVTNRLTSSRPSLSAKIYTQNQNLRARNAAGNLGRGLEATGNFISNKIGKPETIGQQFTNITSRRPSSVKTSELARSGLGLGRDVVATTVGETIASPGRRLQEISRVGVGNYLTKSLPSEGTQLLTGVGVSPEKSRVLGPVAGVTLGVLDFFPPTGGKASKADDLLRAAGKLPSGAQLKMGAGIQNVPTNMIIERKIPLDKGRVEAFKKMIQSGKKLDPLFLKRVGDNLVVEDGKHRLRAFKELGFETIPGAILGAPGLPKPPLKSVRTIAGPSAQKVESIAKGARQKMGTYNAEATAETWNKIQQKLNPPAPVKKYTVTDVANMIGKATREGIDVPPITPYEPKLIRGAIDRTLRSIEGVFKSQGEAGNQIVKLVRGAQQEGAILAGKASVEMERALKSLSDEELNVFADVAEGRIVASTPGLRKALGVWDAIRTDIANRASDSGLKIKIPGQRQLVDWAPRENYFPHLVPAELIDNQKARNEALTRAVQSGWATSISEAEKKFNDFVLRKIKRRYGNLEQARINDFPIFEKDPRKVLLSYIDSAYRRVAESKVFGPEDSRLYMLVDKIGRDGFDSDLSRRALDRILGKEDISSFSHKASEVARGVQTITKLGLGAVTNVGQSLSTALKVGPVATAKAIGRTLGRNKEEARMFAQQTGEILGSSIEDFVRQAGGDTSSVSEFLRRTGFSASERFNRTVATNAGKIHAEQLAARLLKSPADDVTKRALREIGLDPQKIISQGGVDADDLLNAGRNVSQATQFTTGAMDLPYAWTTPMGKVLTQFKSFAFKQAQFIAKHSKYVGRELRLGNPRPLAQTLITMGVLAPVVGEILNDVKSILRNKKRDEGGLERYLNNVFAVVSLGLLADVGTLVTGKYGTQGTVGTVLGPTASDALSGASAVQSLFRDRKTMTGAEELGARVTPAARFVTKRIPVVGPALESAVFDSNFSDPIFGGSRPSASPKVKIKQTAKPKVIKKKKVRRK